MANEFVSLLTKTSTIIGATAYGYYSRLAGFQNEFAAIFGSHNNRAIVEHVAAGLAVGTLASLLADSVISSPSAKKVDTIALSSGYLVFGFGWELFESIFTGRIQWEQIIFGDAAGLLLAIGLAELLREK